MKGPKRKTNFSQIPATFRAIRAQQKYMEMEMLFPEIIQNRNCNIWKTRMTLFKETKK
jgi:hypothetical protein